ncbi:MAG: N-6 DNA methylase [bacterium]|nr:N-6 DNA methylase [bacterium]
MRRTTHRSAFTAVRTEGGILPAELLERLAAGDKEIAGTSPADYHLGPNERLGEAVNRSWSRLLGAWASFRDALQKAPEGDPATRLTRERWLLLLFQELGYGRLLRSKAAEVDGKSFALSHLWHHSPIHLMGARLTLDRRTPGVAGAAAASPHGLVQEYLNRSDEHLWGFVSNGLALRLLRDHHSLTRQAYVELDLETIMEGELYSEFLLLWLVCHQSRVDAEKPEECWLERWFQTSRDEGVRALDKLRDGVQTAIEKLGQGFLRHRANTALQAALEGGELDGQEYYRELLRLVYRLIFLFVAEDRDALLNPAAPDAAKDRYLRFYATRHLRGLADRHRGGPHGDLWRGLRLVMGKLGEGCGELALPALGSFLWRQGAIPHLAGCELGNEDLLAALLALGTIEDRGLRYPVNWRNVGSEELGSIYESLLELHPRFHREAGEFELATAAGHERKTTGSYYTPSSLVDCLLDSALDPVLDEAAAKPDPEAAILALTVCDPACGSGHFLVAAARRIAKRLAAVRSGEDEPSPEAVQHALRDVVGRCLYGVDINPMAVELCKVSLWMEAIEPGKPLSFLDHHIQVGNSLLGATPALLEKGIPDAAFKPIEGDDKAFCRELKKYNKQARETRQETLFDLRGEPWERIGDLASGLLDLDGISDATAEGVRRKEERWGEILQSEGYETSRLWADAWCAAFLWEKVDDSEKPYPITEQVFRKMEQNPRHVDARVLGEVRRLAEEYGFLHWHLAFPGVLRTAGEAAAGIRQSGSRAGFDVVLGNPPWVRQELLKPIKPLLGRYESYSSTADSSVYFLELGIQLLGTSGGLAMLTPNKWLRANYGAKLRDLLKQETEIRLVVDFGHAKHLFHNIDVFPAAIGLAGRTVRSSETEKLQFVRAFDQDLKRHSLAELMRSHSVSVSYRYLTTDRWRLESDSVNALLDRLMGSAERLELEAKPLSGIKTGFNKAFYLSTEEHSALVSAYPESKQLFQKFLRGRDIGRWRATWGGFWHLVLESSQNKRWPWTGIDDEQQAEDVFAATYPGAYWYLKKHKRSLQRRSDQGEYWWELRSCDYYSTLAAPKIVVQCIAFHSRFALDRDGHLINNKAIAIPTSDPFVLGVLNSRVAWWIIYRTFQRMKDDGISVDVNALARFPLPSSGIESRRRISELVETSLQRASDSSIPAVEETLNQEVYDLYNLSHEERRTLEQSLPPRDPLEVAAQHAIDTDEPYQTLLDPPPADPRVAHPPREQEPAAATVVAFPSAPPEPAPYQQEPELGEVAELEASYDQPSPGTATPSERILAWLRAHPDWHARAEVLAALGDLSASQWSSAIRELAEFGEVEKMGEKRGTRYRIRPSVVGE